MHLVCARLATTSLTTTSQRVDQHLVNALKVRMGNSAALLIGSSNALCQGYIVKLDPQNYKNVARLGSDGAVYIPAHFAAQYFGKPIESEKDSYINLTALCESSKEYTLTFFRETGLAIITPADVESFEDGAKKINGYTNSAYCQRMVQFFNDPALPEPRNNTEQSRKVLVSAEYPEYVLDWTTLTYATCYSPSILSTKDAMGKEVLYVSYELTDLLNNVEIATVAKLLKSTDGGVTWTQVAEVKGLRWPRLFEVNGTLYMAGTDYDSSQGKIVRFNADHTYKGALISGVHLAGPTATLIHNGRIYAGDRMASAPVDANLLDPASWTVPQNPLSILTQKWYLSTSGEKTVNDYTLMEGNALLGKDGAIYNLLRIQTNPANGWAALLKLSEDNRSFSIVESCNSLVAMPTTASKFTVRYDEATGLYITFTAMPSMDLNTNQRNVICMTVSEDLIHWEFIDVILVDREMMNPRFSALAHGFNYVDWTWQGDDLLLVVREATGRTGCYHDGTYLTLYRVEDYAKLIAEYRTGEIYKNK